MYDVKNIDKWGYNYNCIWLSGKHGRKRRNWLVTMNLSFSHNVFKSCVVFFKNEYPWGKRLHVLFHFRWFYEQCRSRSKFEEIAVWSLIYFWKYRNRRTFWQLTFSHFHTMFSTVSHIGDEKIHQQENSEKLIFETFFQINFWNFFSLQ